MFSSSPPQTLLQACLHVISSHFESISSLASLPVPIVHLIIDFMMDQRYYVSASHLFSSILIDCVRRSGSRALNDENIGNASG